MKKIKVGIIGCGTIGSEMARACQTRMKGSVDLAGVCDLAKEKAEALQKTLEGKTPILEIDDLIKSSDRVVEAAGAKVSVVVALATETPTTRGGMS